jgi:hypothetical protein
VKVLRNGVVVLALLAAAVAVVVLMWSLTPQGRKDTCLDGGGRWLEAGVCEGGLHDGEDLKLRF